METTLQRITQMSKENPDMVFTSIGHLINKELLMECHKEMDGDKAVGIDGITKDEYGQKLDENRLAIRRFWIQTSQRILPESTASGSGRR